MPKKIAISTLNASTIDILNTIRANASAAYQSSIPTITKAHELPAVGEVLYGYPALANEFISALVNRIALVRAKSASFNNPYRDLKKGFLEYGETVEEVFVNMAKAREFSVEKAEARELKRTLPDVRSAFHAMNWKVQYPVSIQLEDLKRAFLSEDGVRDLIDRIIDSVYTAAEYDEYLLFKYMIIKAVTKGNMYPVVLSGNSPSDAAVAFRGVSNMLPFVNTVYNEAGVHTNTARNDQYIFMDANYNASFDVNVLASAFNMGKADLFGHLKLIDSWTTFDNDRFAEIVANVDTVELVTDDELAIMADVRAVLVDAEWFQIYDNLAIMTERDIASGLYWNYFYNTWKTVSHSPFSNAIVFVANGVNVTSPATITFDVDSVSVDNNAMVITLAQQNADSISAQSVNFVQTQPLTAASVAVHKYGAFIVPVDSKLTTLAIVATNAQGDSYEGTITLASIEAGATVTLTKAD